MLMVKVSVTSEILHPNCFDNGTRKTLQAYTAPRAILTDPGELLAREHIHHSGAADACLHHHKPRMLINHFADDSGFLAKRVCTQSVQRRIDIFWRGDGEQFAFVRHIKRIQSENFARTFYFFVYRDRCFIEEHADLCRLRDLGERAGYAATQRDQRIRWMSIPLAKIAATSSCNGALSLAISVSNSNPSRTDMMAIPCTAIGPLIMILGRQQLRVPDECLLRSARHQCPKC